MAELKSWVGYVGILAGTALAGMWAYIRPVPRAVCEERHLHLAEDISEIKSELAALRDIEFQILMRLGGPIKT